MTKRTTELAKGDTVIDGTGRVLMTVRKVAQAVDINYSVVWFFGPRGGANCKGFANSAEWAVRA